ncbi:PRD domain-containing protein [Clostridium perfringens]|nr:PRD domain-containing protein [Clostridium perfringens]
MIIHKVLNNNVVTSFNDNNEEVVVTGRGIAFKKKYGDTIDKSKIDKIFILSNPNINNKFIELIKNIPIEYTDISEQIIAYSKNEIGKDLNDSIYISLTDHIYNSIQRQKKGIIVKNGLTLETKRLYKEEYKIGIKALEIIRKEFDINLPEDEAAFIALHIVNAQLNEDMPILMDITKLIQEILNIVKYNFNIEFDEESLSYYRFITHLKFFAQRMFSNKVYKDEKDNDLFEIVKEKYYESYKCVNKVQRFIVEKYSYNLTKEEMLYLIIHIEKLINKK